MSPYRRIIWLSVLIFGAAFTTNIAAQSLRELAREQAIRNPGVPLVQPASPADYLPKAIEDVAKEADLVVQGKLSKIHSYLSPKEDRILTDYRILEPKWIAGRLPSTPSQHPGPGVPLILTVYGGEITVEGVQIRGVDNNREAIKDGGSYLVFLKESRRREPGRYEIYYGGAFEVAGEEVRPLLKKADDIFKGTADPGLTAMLRRIQGASSRIR